RTHCYRFHVEDPILFKKSLKGSIEHGHANTLTLSMSSVAYWYQAEPHKPFPDLPGPKARLPRRDINFRDIHKWRDAWRQAQEYETLWGNEKMDDEE
ncbi:DUF2961 domain-containing protein, partial [bacterium]|nr:DUF2961 domain-containing protein [bacterium]